MPEQPEIKHEGYSPLEGGGIQRTDMNCHNCNKNFIAEIDFSIQGNHIIQCPHCGHEHYRSIENGKITETRWGNDSNATKVKTISVWKSSVIKAKTSTAAAFIRDRWLNRSDLNVS